MNKSTEDASQNGSVNANDSAEANDSYWDAEGENQKSSDDEEASNRYDRFGHSEELENATSAVKTESNEGNDATEAVTSQA